jgi:hypothetical protein
MEKFCRRASPAPVFDDLFKDLMQGFARVAPPALE